LGCQPPAREARAELTWLPVADERAIPKCSSANVRCASISTGGAQTRGAVTAASKPAEEANLTVRLSTVDTLSIKLSTPQYPAGRLPGLTIRQ
jgi:hypothetical protein